MTLVQDKMMEMYSSVLCLRKVGLEMLVVVDNYWQQQKRILEQFDQTFMDIIFIFQATLFVEQIFTKFDTDQNGTIDFRVRSPSDNYLFVQ